MKKMSFVLVWIVLGFPLMAAGAGIDWQSHRQGMDKAKLENKKIFLHFKSNRCGYCVKMDRITFSDAKVIAYLNTHFVPIRVNGDIDRELAKAYKVPGYPDNRFFDEKENQVFQFFGFYGPDAFMVFLEYIKTESYTSMNPMQFYESRKAARD